jgi:hypothetical protein
MLKKSRKVQNKKNINQNYNRLSLNFLTFLNKFSFAFLVNLFTE